MTARAETSASGVLSDGGEPRLEARARALFEEEHQRILRRTDRMFAILLVLQWVAATFVAFVISPYTWAGKVQVVHGHVYAAFFLGGLITSFPVALALLRPGYTSTRVILACAQMLWSALLIHLTGGRIETHFHVFGSLAFLAFYRDAKILVPATIIVAADHFIRGIYWPESVYGVVNPEWWRFLEHAGWVIFIDIFLILNCVSSYNDLERLSRRQAELEWSQGELEEAAANLEVRVEERTAELESARQELEDSLGELEAAQRDLAESSRYAGMAEVASNVLHNVGNVLNSVNVTVQTLTSQVRASKVDGVAKAARLLEEHDRDLADFLTADDRGRRLPEFFGSLARHLAGEQERVLHDLAGLQGNVDHIRAIIATQQENARVTVTVSKVRLAEVIESARALAGLRIDDHEVEVRVEGEDGAEIVADRHRLLLILTNLLKNARESVKAAERARPRIVVRVERMERERSLRLSIEDNGVGIAPEALKRIFEHGFTTKEHGHGFGLHSSANAAAELGGSLKGQSAGVGEGTTFVLELPLTDRSADATSTPGQAASEESGPPRRTPGPDRSRPPS